MRVHSRTKIDPNNPRANGVCDRCGFWYNHDQLKWQYEYRGINLHNIRLLVCDICLDKPNEGLRPLFLPPDPEPILDARPENYTVDEDSP